MGKMLLTLLLLPTICLSMQQEGVGSSSSIQTPEAKMYSSPLLADLARLNSFTVNLEKTTDCPELKSRSWVKDLEVSETKYNTQKLNATQLQCDPQMFGLSTIAASAERASPIEDYGKKRASCQAELREMKSRTEDYTKESQELLMWNGQIEQEIKTLKEKKTDLTKQLKAAERDMQDAAAKKEEARQATEQCMQDKSKVEQKMPKFQADIEAIKYNYQDLQKSAKDKIKQNRQCEIDKHLAQRNCDRARRKINDRIEALGQIPDIKVLEDAIQKCQYTAHDIAKEVQSCNHAAFDIVQDKASLNETKFVCGYMRAACERLLTKYVHANELNCVQTDHGMECAKGGAKIVVANTDLQQDSALQLPVTGMHKTYPPKMGEQPAAYTVRV